MKMRAPRSASAAVRSGTPGDEAIRPSPLARTLAISSVAGKAAAPAGRRAPSAGLRCQRDAASSASGGSA